MKTISTLNICCWGMALLTFVLILFHQTDVRIMGAFQAFVTFTAFRLLVSYLDGRD